MKVHYSSVKHDYETPQYLFDELDAEFHFDLDVCATHKNAKCDRYFTPEMDGLSRSWGGICWMNPPYGRQIGKWMKKAYIESQNGSTVVCLVPSRTDTRWWHDYVMKGEVRFIKGRITFVGTKGHAPFPCAVVIFR